VQLIALWEVVAETVPAAPQTLSNGPKSCLTGSPKLLILKVYFGSSRTVVAESEYAILKPKYPGQRRLLTLDGGGIRGLVTLGILEKLEADLRAASGGDAGFHLCDYFDFISGTSTGANPGRRPCDREVGGGIDQHRDQ
jgi:Patatin-like phospholipase